MKIREEKERMRKRERIGIKKQTMVGERHKSIGKNIKENWKNEIKEKNIK